jgi:hypothetical protein
MLAVAEHRIAGGRLRIVDDADDRLAVGRGGSVIPKTLQPTVSPVVR